MATKLTINRSNILSQKGFTLVELAIVMIIIGLLISGILKGQELVESARVAATVTQIKGIDAAISTFRDKYQALPGDIANPGARLPECAAYPGPIGCNVGGNGDGFVSGASDSNYLLVHLAAAGLISDYSVSGAVGIPWAGRPDFLAAKTGNQGIIWTLNMQGAGDPSFCPAGPLLGLPNLPSGLYIALHIPGCPPLLLVKLIE